MQVHEICNALASRCACKCMRFAMPREKGKGKSTNYSLCLESPPHHLGYVSACMKVPNAGASRLPGRVHAMPGENCGSIS
nr:MAG TPA: hypothetical protein [Caudoviricetes sp.]